MAMIVILFIIEIITALVAFLYADKVISLQNFIMTHKFYNYTWQLNIILYFDKRLYSLEKLPKS
jgi:hypothetical protein